MNTISLQKGFEWNQVIVLQWALYKRNDHIMTAVIADPNDEKFIFRLCHSQKKLAVAQVWSINTYYWLDNHGFFIIEEIQHFLSNLWDKLHSHVFQGDNRWDGTFPQEGATSVANSWIGCWPVFIFLWFAVISFKILSKNDEFRLFLKVMWPEKDAGCNSWTTCS